MRNCNNPQVDLLWYARIGISLSFYQIIGFLFSTPCQYLSTRTCSYIRPKICDGSEELRPGVSSINSSACPAVRIPAKCNTIECDRDCDERSTPWSLWTVCPPCTTAGARRPPLSIRLRRITGGGAVYCITKQGRICDHLKICKDGQDDDLDYHDPYSANSNSTSDIVESNYFETSEVNVQCSYQLLRDRCNFTLLKCSSYEQMVPRVEDPHCPYRLTWVVCSEEEKHCEAWCLILSEPWSPWSSCSASCEDEGTIDKQRPFRVRHRTAAKLCIMSQIVDCRLLPRCQQEQRDEPPRYFIFDSDLVLLIYVFVIVCLLHYHVCDCQLHNR